MILVIDKMNKLLPNLAIDKLTPNAKANSFPLNQSDSKALLPTPYNDYHN